MSLYLRDILGSSSLKISLTYNIPSKDNYLDNNMKEYGIQTEVIVNALGLVNPILDQLIGNK